MFKSIPGNNEYIISLTQDIRHTDGTKAILMGLSLVPRAAPPPVLHAAMSVAPMTALASAVNEVNLDLAPMFPPPGAGSDLIEGRALYCRGRSPT